MQSAPEAHRNPQPIDRRERILLGLLLTITFLTFFSVLGFGFVYDDDLQILRNPAIASWSHWPDWFTHHVWYQLPGVGPRYYRPLLLAWFALNHSLYGLAAWGYHLNSLLLHLFVTGMVYITSRRILNDGPAALFAAAIFALHPLHVETVAWISDVNDSLLAAFLLTAFYAYLRWREEDSNAWAVVCLIGFALALLTKEVAVIFPVLLLFAEWWLPTPSRSSSRLRARLIAAGSAIVLAGFLIVRAEVLRGGRTFIVPLSWPLTALTAPKLLWFYLVKLAWPAGLSEHYPVPYATSLHDGWWAVLFCGSVGGAVFLLYRKLGDTRVLYAALWFILPLLPALNARWLNDRDPLHDRYLYLSVIGFAWLGGLLLARLRATLTPAPLKWTLVAANIYVLTLAFASAAQSFIWTDDLSLFRRAIEIAPDNPNSHINYASILMKRGRCQDAIAEFSSGIALNPSWTNLNIALCYMRMGDTQKAESTFSGILKFDPRNADAYHGIGLTRLAQNDPVTAEARFRTALQLQPAGWAYHLSLGLALKQQGKIEEARKEFEAEVHTNSNSANAQQARDELGRLPLPGPPSAIVQ